MTKSVGYSAPFGPGGESPIFSTSDPHNPQASTDTSSPAGAGSGTSASAGSLDASRTTARIGVS